MLQRQLLEVIRQRLYQGKIIIIYGARQVGKTTLTRMLFDTQENSLYLNCDEPDIREKLTNRTSTELELLINHKKLIIIDEAQRVANIGITLKLLADNFQDRQIIATGSSAFDLSNHIKEPLTGRKLEFLLYPISMKELNHQYSSLELQRILENRMIYGMYPEIIMNQDAELLKELADSYLYKDVLQYQSIKNPEILHRLLQALALQISNEVSYTELSGLLGIDKKTINNYISLLEKAFIIFRLPPFSRNLRNELKKMRKIYFYDTGIRNALINNFNPLNMRNDAGALFENFIILERIKNNSNARLNKNYYFWRTHQQQEIDFIEDYSGKLEGYELKYQTEKFKKPKQFLEAYPESRLSLITRENISEFLDLQ